jgi:5-methylcytosine-specific restriction protein B
MQEYINLINAFNSIDIIETDVTTKEDQKNFNQVKIVKYIFNGDKFTTNKLYYKNVREIERVSNKKQLLNYFEDPIYWLDVEKHPWPKGSGESDLDNLVINDIIDESKGNNDLFRNFLLKLANNNKTGIIQKITRDGRSNQYHHNFENNNHWHDIILLIKAFISSKGKDIDRKYFSSLVFKWDGNKNSERKRATLTDKAYYCNRSMITTLKNNLTKTFMEIDKQKNVLESIKLLKTKKQIILQGAPGTGKTYATAEIALRAIGTAGINFSDRKKVMAAYGKAVKNKQIVFTTFHQSLDYEEFIEGIKPNNDSDTVTYDIASGIFKNMCKDAVQKDSLKDLQLAIESFKEECINATEKITLETKGKGKFTVTYRGGITFRVRSKNSQAEEGVDFPASIENIEKLYRGENDGMYNKTYVWGILNHLKSKYKLGDYKSDDALDKKYVLIIDEINRGNISKIFGELITLLEADKRIGQKNSVSCKLPYSGDEFGVPDNLYIIGTMNTTDRSLGHIDYAVRRRFGFVTLEADKDKVNDFYASVNVSGNIKDKAVKLFNTISDLITDNCSPEFQYKDIMVGHSYFMAENIDELRLKLDFEIKPLLCEYVKDGLLTLSLDDIKNKIDTLSV